MTNEQRIELIVERLQKKFHPQILEVLDESYKHKGHAGAQNGAGHFHLTISCENFPHLTRLARHQAIYDELSDLIPHEIHAIAIKFIAA